MGFIDWMYRLTGDADLDEQEERFHYGDSVHVIDGFYKGAVGIIKDLHPATTLSHGWVGYSLTLLNGTNTEFIEVDNLESTDAFTN